jgi:hypothetical protein
VRNRIEIAFEIRVIHRLIPGLDVTAYFLQRLVSRTAWTEPIGTIFKVSFEDRLQDQQGRHLHHSVPHRRDSQRPQFPIRLRDVDTPYGCRRIGLLPQGFLNLIEESGDAGARLFDLLNRQSVHSGRALVGSHP